MDLKIYMVVLRFAAFKGMSQDFNPLPDDNFKFDENGRKLSKWVEDTVGKGEIAR